jgi:hypothetical protein
VFEHKKFSSGNQAYGGCAKQSCFDDFLQLQTIGLELNNHVADRMRRFFEV